KPFGIGGHLRAIQRRGVQGRGGEDQAGGGQGKEQWVFHGMICLQVNHPAGPKCYNNLENSTAVTTPRGTPWHCSAIHREMTANVRDGYLAAVQANPRRHVMTGLSRLSSQSCSRKACAFRGRGAGWPPARRDRKSVV